MKSLLSTLVIALVAGLPVMADPMDDALYIVDQTLTQDHLEGGFAAVADLMVGNLQNEVAKGGDTISDDAARVVSQMLSQHMIESMMEAMREPLAKAYVYNLSPESLEAYRAFIETPAGQEVIGTSGALLLESYKIGEQVGGQVAGPAVAAMQADIRADRWPEGTLKSTRAELRELFDQPPVSDMPPER